MFLLTGQSGLGKSTLMNTLFKSKVSRKSVLATAQEKIPKTIEIKSISHGMKPFLCIPSVFSLSVGLSAKIHSSHTFSYLNLSEVILLLWPLKIFTQTYPLCLCLPIFVQPSLNSLSSLICNLKR